METKELKQKYGELYDILAKSKETDNMKHFGSIMTEMFDWFAENKPERAEEWLWKMEAIRWDNYLTPKEAEKIVTDMSPSAPWSFQTWENALKQAGLATCEAGIYNEYALWVEMNKQMSDHSETYKKYGITPDLPMIHALAIDNLKDKDGWYNIREYFSL